MADIYVSSNDFWAVVRTVNDLQADVKRVTGLTPAIKNEAAGLSGNAIIVGTIGRSTVINNLISSGKLDVTGVQGKWESAVIQVVDNPVSGVSRGLVIAGSDRRGTIFGIYDVSEKMGVSPLYYWADVPSKTKTTVFVKKGTYKQGEPSVKYRGIFINDENPALSGWANEKFGGFNHLFYEKVFELILRLRGNYLWPAMWGKKFNMDDAQNPVVADQYGIVMGTSHHEPMMRSQSEWTSSGLGEWNYVTNGQNLRNFWDFGINRNKAYDNMVTIGMRGDGDAPMPGNTMQEKMNTLNTIVADQRQILANRINPDLTQVPQVWAIYKEVQEFYDNGFRVPEDVTHLWCDDNHGNLRRLPTANERGRAGGAGVYYHVDYVGGPQSYKWINTVPITKIWEQMNMAYEHDAKRIWIVNVGDIKPMEFPMTFFLKMAWNVNQFNKDNLADFAVSWATEQFGATYASDIADIMMKYSKYNGRRKPEIITKSTYNVTNYNEAERVLDEWNRIADKCERIYSRIPAQYKDAFYQLVYYPAVQCKRVMEMHYYAGLNNLYQSQGRAMTNDYANLTQTTFNAEAGATTFYHTTMANGKWNHIMNQPHIGSTSWDGPAQNNMPSVLTNSPLSGSEMGVAIEGTTTTWPNAAACWLPDFSVYTRDPHFIEVFNKKSGWFNFTITPNNAWIKVNTTQGLVNKQARIWVSIDWNSVPQGANVTGSLTVSGGNLGSVTVNVKAVNPSSPVPSSLDGFIESNGYISMEAEHYTRKTDVNGLSWQRIPDYGRTVSSMAIIPSTSESVSPPANSPSLEYQFYLFNPGNYTVSTYTAPSLAFDPAHGLRYAVSVDDQAPQTVQIFPAGDNASLPEWGTAVKDNIIIRNTTFTFSSSGYHTLKLWMVDPGVVLQKIVINTGGLQTTYLGPPESYFGARISAPVSSKVECETMTFGGPYANTMGGPFNGAALYANGDYAARTQSFASSGVYTLSVRGASNNNTAANVAIYMNGIRKGEMTFTGAAPAVKTLSIPVSASNHEIKLVMESDVGASDAFLDYYQLDAITSAFSQIEAESYSAQSGIQTEVSSEGGLDVGYIQNGDYIVFSNIDFGGNASIFDARVASATAGGNIEIRLDGIAGTLAGTCPVAGTGGWQTWTSITCNIGAVAGMHDLYLKFTGGSGFLFNVNWFRFNSASTLYEAENSTTLTSSTVETGYPGYTGTGFVNFNAFTGAAIQWNNVYSSVAGTKNLKFRYALASGTRNLDVFVNGVNVISNAPFDATGNWATWGEKTVQVPMNSGNNTLKVITTGTEGPNIDNVNAASGL